MKDRSGFGRDICDSIVSTMLMTSLCEISALIEGPTSGAASESPSSCPWKGGALPFFSRVFPKVVVVLVCAFSQGGVVTLTPPSVSVSSRGSEITRASDVRCVAESLERGGGWQISRTTGLLICAASVIPSKMEELEDLSRPGVGSSSVRTPLPVACGPGVLVSTA
jgi:hypothetical protein